MSFFVGIDLGTTSVKTILVSESGELLKQESVAYDIDTGNDGKSEISPEKWFRATLCALKSLLSGCSSVSAIGVTGQMHSLSVLDGDGNPVRNTIMWNDRRTAAQAAEIRRFAKDNGLPYIEEIVTTGSPAASLMYVRDNEPENFSRIKLILIGHSYLVYRLTGHYGTDYCEASTSSLYDIENDEWSSGVLGLIGLDLRIMPEVSPSCSNAGLLSEEITEMLGLTKRPAVIEGTGDNIASIVSLDTPCISMGTSGVYIEKRTELLRNKKGKNVLFSAELPVIDVIVQGAVQSVGSTVEWLNTVFSDGKGYELFSNLPEKVDDDLIFFPYLCGDKTVFRDSTLKGALSGLSLATEKRDIIKASFEGIAFAFRQMIDAVKNCYCEEIVITGGLSNNADFVQTLANVLKTKLKVVYGNPGAVFGAALLAMQACGICPDAAKTAGAVTFYPDEESFGYYDRKYSRFIKIYDRIKR